ncbi:MAG: hypothetical protein KGL39_60545, partial [Patescibacteria group bacterium]|nr:hypothetical protein [Patescibacteria group bacterium]
LVIRLWPYEHLRMEAPSMANAAAPVKGVKFVAKVVAFFKSAQGKRDIALVFAAAEALYQAAKQLGVV